MFPVWSAKTAIILIVAAYAGFHQWNAMLVKQAIITM